MLTTARQKRIYEYLLFDSYVTDTPIVWGYIKNSIKLAPKILKIYLRGGERTVLFEKYKKILLISQFFVKSIEFQSFSIQFS